MKPDGKLTGWTALLILAGFGLGIVGAALAPPTTPTLLLVLGWVCFVAAASNIYRPIRKYIAERDIRADERARLTGDGRQR